VPSSFIWVSLFKIIILDMGEAYGQLLKVVARKHSESYVYFSRPSSLIILL
jgi:hypothetical protein